VKRQHWSYNQPSTSSDPTGSPQSHFSYRPQAFSIFRIGLNKPSTITTSNSTSIPQPIVRTSAYLPASLQRPSNRNEARAPTYSIPDHSSKPSQYILAHEILGCLRRAKTFGDRPAPHYRKIVASVYAGRIRAGFSCVSALSLANHLCRSARRV
jgi:hypothetical protein